MIRKSRKNVGLIGLGIIGTRVATQLRAKGFHTYVWSRSPHPVPNFLSSAAEVADVCPVIQIFVTDGAALLEILQSLTANLTPQHLVISSATVGLEATLEAAKLVEARGAKFLDAPFTGSKDAAANGQLIYFIGGSDDAFAQAKPVLEASSKTIVRVGKIGDAAIVKIATNMISAATVQTLAEALAIVKAAGLDPAVMTSVIEHHGTRSALIDQKLATILSGDFAPHFALRHMLKDVNLGLRFASTHDLYLPATSAASIALTKGVQNDWADLDYAAVAKTFGLGEKPHIEENAEVAEPANHQLSSAETELSPEHQPAEPIPAEFPDDETPHESALHDEHSAADLQPHEEPPTAYDFADSQPIPAIPPLAVHKPAPAENPDEDDALRTTMKIDLDSFRTTAKLDDIALRMTAKLDEDEARTTEKIIDQPPPSAIPIAIPRTVEESAKAAKRTPIPVHVPEDREIVGPQSKRGFFRKLFSKKDPDNAE